MLPLVIAGAAGTVGSSILNGIGASKADKARSASIAAEMQRQRAFDAEADAINKGARERYVGFGDNMAERAGTLGDMFKSSTVASAPGGLPATGSKFVSDVLADRMAATKAYGNQQSEALGELRSFGDLLGEVNRSQARDGGYIGQIGGFKRGSAAVNALELDAASHAGDKYKFWGDVLGGASKVALMAGLGGVAAPAAAGGAAAAGASAAPAASIAYGGFPVVNPWNAAAMNGLNIANMFARGN